MAGFRKPEVSREQLTLWSQRLDDAIPLDHPVRLFDALLRSDAFAATFAEWESAYDLTEGKPPYHPRDLSGLYLYGMLNRIRSSRQLESACYNRLDVTWLMSGQTPDHSTVAAFVTGHAQGLRRLFGDVIKVGLQAELIKLDQVATDGTKVEADAGRGSVCSAEKIAERLSALDEKIAAMQAEWERNEARESNVFGDEAPWASRGDRSQKQQLATLQRKQALLKEALAEIARRQKESSGEQPVKAIASTTDPNSRSMKDKEGRTKPNYNAQLSVDAETSMIVAAQVNDAPDDSGQLSPMLAEVIENCGRAPAAASADSGYNTGPELARLETQEISGYLPDAGVRSHGAQPDAATQEALQAAHAGNELTEAQWLALPRDGGGRIEKAAFAYDSASDTYRCPAGETMVFLRISRSQKKWGEARRRQYGFAANPPCALCPHATACCNAPARGRTINRDQYEEHRERLRTRMASAAGRQIYKRQRETVEPRFGYIKRGLGVRRFLRRGIEKVRTEWAMVATAVNIGVLLQQWGKVEGVI